MAIRYVVPDPIAELSSWTYTVTLKVPDATGVLIPLALTDVQTLTLTLYDLSSGTIINSINHVDIKNTGRGTYAATTGKLTISFHSADTPIVSATLDLERHVALIEAIYNAGIDRLEHEVEFTVRNLTRVP